VGRRRFAAVILIAAAAALAGCGKVTGTADLNALLTESWRAYSTGDFDFAEDTFRRAAGNPDATAEQRYGALLGLATTYHWSTSPDLSKARESYLELAELGGDQPRRQSVLGLAQIDLAEGKKAEAQLGLMQLIKDFPDSLEANEAALHLADSYCDPTWDEAQASGFALPSDEQMQRGIQVLQDRLESHPDNPLAGSMHVMIADQYIQLKEFPKAVDHLLMADKEGVEGVLTRVILLWRVARIAEKELKDYELAEQYYERYVDEFPRYVLIYRVMKSLERVRALRTAEES